MSSSAPGCSLAFYASSADNEPSVSAEAQQQPGSPLPCSFSSLPLILPAARQCRICLLGTESRHKPLISPCRCSGSVQHVHVHCLAHWIEVSSRKLAPPPHCELCGYRYHRKPFVDLTRLHFPFMDLCDRLLNSLCLLLMLIMGLCAWVAVQHLRLAERRPLIAASRPNRASRVALSQPDLTILVAVVLFFTAFFLAMFTQYRAEVTLFRAIGQLWATNRNWRIRNYRQEGEGGRGVGGGCGKKRNQGQQQLQRVAMGRECQQQQGTVATSGSRGGKR